MGFGIKSRGGLCDAEGCGIQADASDPPKSRLADAEAGNPGRSILHNGNVFSPLTTTVMSTPPVQRRAENPSEVAVLHGYVYFSRFPSHLPPYR